MPARGCSRLTRRLPSVPTESGCIEVRRALEHLRGLRFCHSGLNPESIPRPPSVFSIHLDSPAIRAGKSRHSNTPACLFFFVILVPMHREESILTRRVFSIHLDCVEVLEHLRLVYFDFSSLVGFIHFVDGYARCLSPPAGFTHGYLCPIPSE